MTTRILGLLSLMLAPAGVIYLAGFNTAAHYVGIGSVLALQLAVLARPVAAFAFLLPIVYAAAAITAQSTDSVVALVLAIAAAVGAAASQGLHRGLVALLAAVLIGSFEAASAGVVAERASFLLAGSSYGFLLSVTLLRGLRFEVAPVHPQSALAYAVMLALVTLVAWFAARVAGFAHPWWLPLAVAAVSEPVRHGTAARALLRSALAATAAMTLVFVTDAFDPPMVRAALLILTLGVGLAASRRQPAILGVLLAAVLVLLSSHGALHEPPIEHLTIVLPAYLTVLAAACLGHWLLWSVREGGRIPAA